MPIFASLLRGINVGGRNMVPMKALVELYAQLGLEDARTLLQSGNVVFRAGDADRAELAARLKQAVAKRFGAEPEIFLRSEKELRAAVAANPFPAAARDDPSHLLIMFFDKKPTGAPPDWKGPERLQLAGKELYLFYPEGIGLSKLTNAVLERALKAPGTARNWNTVNKLITMCSEL
jgi:uncharacterized protein (DUF1697 family)